MHAEYLGMCKYLEAAHSLCMYLCMYKPKDSVHAHTTNLESTTPDPMQGNLQIQSKVLKPTAAVFLSTFFIW